MVSSSDKKKVTIKELAEIFANDTSNTLKERSRNAMDELEKKNTLELTSISVLFKTIIFNESYPDKSEEFTQILFDTLKNKGLQNLCDRAKKHLDLWEESSKHFEKMIKGKPRIAKDVALYEPLYSVCQMATLHCHGDQVQSLLLLIPIYINTSVSLYNTCKNQMLQYEII